MNKLMSSIGTFIIACIILAIPILTPISIMLHWHQSISFWLCMLTLCELMFLSIYLYFYVLWCED